MIKFSKNDIVDLQKYENNINHAGFIYYAHDRANTLLKYLKNRSLTLAARATQTMKLNSGCEFRILTKEAIHGYLTWYENCPERYFHTGKTQGISLDMKRVLEKLYSNGKAVEFLDDYMAYRSTESKHNSLKTIINSCVHPVAKNTDGEDLCRIPFVASKQKNLRFNYRQFDIISQIPKEACDTISVEDGYFLAWGDFAQSDFRIAYNLFLRSPENDAIMNKYRDKYEALARIVHETLGREFDLDKFKEERAIYKRLTLATIYGTRGSQVATDQEFIQTFTQFLNECPKYKEYYSRLEDNVSLGTPLQLNSYFGHEEFIPYIKDKQSVIYDALNSPVQTGTSEVVILTVNSIIDMARSLGLDEDQFSVYLVRHDEPVFRIRKDAIPYLWILEQHKEILVDNWTPLLMEFNYGYNYKTIDTDLEAEIQRSIDVNKDKIEVIPYSIGETNDFYPINPLLKLGVHWISVDGKTIVTYYNMNTGEVLSSLLETTDKDEIILSMRQRFSQIAHKLEGKYNKVLILNNFYDADDYFGAAYFRYKYKIGPELNNTITACKDMVARYCKKSEIPLPDGIEYSGKPFPEQLELLMI